MQADKNPSVDFKTAARLSGLTAHMLVYLSRNDILIPSGHCVPARGRKRLYTFSDVIFLKAIADLLMRGIEIKRLNAALKRAKAEVDTWIDIKKTPRGLLVTDGTEIYIQRNGRLESKTINRQFAFAFMLDIAALHRTVSENWPEKELLKRKVRQPQNYG